MKAKTLQEFIALAKAEPGKLAYASAGPGTPYHLAVELFKTMTGTDLLHVPYKNSGDARNAVIGGHVQIMLDAVTAMKPIIDGGQVRALATTGTTRSAVLPDVPTVSEAGVPGYEATMWLGIMAPTGTPKDVVERLNSEITKTVAKPADPRRLGQAGRRAHDHDPRPVRDLPQGRHREVGQGHPAGRHQGAMKAVRLLSGGAAHGLVEQVRPAFEAATGCTIDGVFGAVGAMKARLLSGEPADLLILSRALIDELAQVGHVVGAVGQGHRRGADRDRRARGRCAARARHGRRPAHGPARRRRDPFPRSRAFDRRHPLRQGDARAWPLGASSPTDCGPRPTARRPWARSPPRRAASPSAAPRRPRSCRRRASSLAAPLPPGCELATTYTCAVTGHAAAPEEAASLIALLTSDADRDARRRLGFA